MPNSYKHHKDSATTKPSKRGNNSLVKPKLNRQRVKLMSKNSTVNKSKPPEVTQLILFNKPFNTLCQFTGESSDSVLADYISIKDVYAAGRLDKDSEGLLLLTNNGQLQHQISHPKHKMAKTYWVQVEGEPNQESITKLQKGVVLKDGITKPAKVRLLDDPTNQLWQRDPPVRYRKNINTHWLEIIIKEGRNRQVRRMTAAVGLPTLRLIRMAIGPWQLELLQPGESRVLSHKNPSLLSS
jgi:23S rRNA pseudouridine2457 synthase